MPALRLTSHLLIQTCAVVFDAHRFASPECLQSLRLAARRFAVHSARAQAFAEWNALNGQHSQNGQVGRPHPFVEQADSRSRLLRSPLCLGQSAPWREAGVRDDREQHGRLRVPRSGDGHALTAHRCCMTQPVNHLHACCTIGSNLLPALCGFYCLNLNTSVHASMHYLPTYQACPKLFQLRPTKHLPELCARQETSCCNTAAKHVTPLPPLTPSTHAICQWKVLHRHCQLASIHRPYTDVAMLITLLCPPHRQPSVRGGGEGVPESVVGHAHSAEPPGQLTGCHLCHLAPPPRRHWCRV